LNSAIFKHFREEEFGSLVKVFDDTPTTGNNIGKRLDRWIFEEKGKNKILYQAEIKNWAARAIGGSNVAIDIGIQKLSELIRQNWNHQFLDINKKEKNGINKVFIEMKEKEGLKNKINGKYEKVPLLIIWEAAHPRGENKQWYRYQVNKKYFDFDYCYIFSCSLYLRYLYAKKVKKISLEMTNVERRLLNMNRLFYFKS